jgi:hypothetical protein
MRWTWTCILLGLVLVVLLRRGRRPGAKEPEPYVRERIRLDGIAFDFGRTLSDSVCPYCGTRFAKAPIRGRKCPQCKERVERASLPHGRKALLTVAEATSYRTAVAAEFAKRMRAQNLKSFQNAKEQAKAAGSPGYVWRTSGDGSVCAVCSQNNGKRFAWNDAPNHGHAGVCDACEEGYCRCWCETIIPD